MAERATPVVEGARVAADDLRHFIAPGFEAANVERVGHGRDVLIETALSDERAGEARKNDERDRRWKLQRCILQGERGDHGRGEKQPERDPAIEAPFRLLHACQVEAQLQALDQGAHPHDRMLDAALQRDGIAEAGLDQQRAKDGDGVER